MSVQDLAAVEVNVDNYHREDKNELTRLTKRHAPSFRPPFHVLSFLLLPWYIDDPENPKCPSRCCKRCDVCCFHRCCGNKYVRHVLILFAAVVIFWVLWCIGVAISLSGLSPVLNIQSLEVKDPCSFDLQVLTKFQLQSSSWISAELKEISSLMYLSLENEPFAKLTFSADEQTDLHSKGVVQSENVELRSGTHALDMVVHMQPLNIPNTALFAAQVMNNTRTKVYVKTTATVRTSALWFPMTLSHDLTNQFSFNEPEIGPPPTPLKMLAVQIESREEVLMPKNKSLAVFSWLTLFLNRSTISVYTPLPHLFLDVVHDGVFIATAHINPIFVFPIFNLSLDVVLERNLSSAQSTSIQHAVDFFNRGQNMSIQVCGAGARGRSLPQTSDFPLPPFSLNYTTVASTTRYKSSSVFHTPLSLQQQAGGKTCFLQALLDSMPLVSFPIDGKVACPVPTKGTAPANFTRKTADNPSGCLPTEWQGQEIVVSAQKDSGSNASSSSVLVPTLIEAGKIIRNETSAFYAQAYVEANVSFDFALYGYFNDLYFDLSSMKEQVGYIKIDAFALTPQQANYRGNVSFQTTNESVMSRRIVDYEDVNSLALVLKGRPNKNTFSDIVVGFETNITSAQKNASEVQETAAYFSFEDNPVNFSLAFDLNAQTLPPLLNISLPEISIAISNNNNNNISSSGKMLEINTEQTRLLSYQSGPFILKNVLRMLCDLSMADNMGDFLNSVIDEKQANKTQSVSVRGISKEKHQQSQQFLIIDFQLNFSADQVKALRESSNSSENDNNNNSGSSFGVGIEITKLLRNDSLMLLQSATNVSWNLPVSLSGTFPRIDVSIFLEPPYNGTTTRTTLASMSVSSFVLRGSNASSQLDVDVLNQSMLIKMLLKSEACNITVAGNSASNVISRIVSHLGVTFNVKNNKGELAKRAKDTLQSLQPPSSVYEIFINSSVSFLQTNVYLNLSSASFPINLTVPSLHLSLSSLSSSSSSEMSTLDFDRSFFSSSASSTSSTTQEKQRLAFLNTLSSHAPVLGKFLNDFVNDRNVGFSLKTNYAPSSSSSFSFSSSSSSPSYADINFELSQVSLSEILDLVSDPKPVVPIPLLACSDDPLSQPAWDWGKEETQYTVNCPAKACTGKATRVSKGIYTSNSSICSAANLEGVVSSCGGKIIVTLLSATTKSSSSSLDKNNTLLFAIEKYTSRSLWPLKSVEPLSVQRNESMLLASVGVVLASLGIPLSGSLPGLGFTIARNTSQVLLRAQVQGFEIPPMNSDLGLVSTVSVLEQQSLMDVISNAKDQGANLTITGLSGPQVIHAVASEIVYALNIPRVNMSALSVLPSSVWPEVRVDVDSDNKSATLTVSTQFTPEFNAGFDLFVGALRTDILIGQLKGFPDGFTVSGSVVSDAFTLKDNACSNFHASFILSAPSTQPVFLTNVMRQFFHGYALNTSFHGTLNASGIFGPRDLSVNITVPPPVSPHPPAETDSRCLCESVWEDQGQFFYGECAKTVSHPNGWCKIQNNSCVGGTKQPLSPTYDSCTKQITRTYYGCECLSTWTYNNTQYTDGGCHNPDDSPQPWCLVKPGSCFGDTFISAYGGTPNFYRSPSTNALYACGTFYSQANMEAACDADPSCFGYNYAPSIPSLWCLAAFRLNNLSPYSGVYYFAKPSSGARPSFRVRDVCGDPNVLQARNSVVLNSVHLLGSGSDNKVVVPCLLPGTFCPYESDSLNSTPLEVLLNLSLVALPFPLQVNLHSNLDIVFQGYGLSPLVSLKIRALNFSSSESESVAIVALISPVNLPLLQRVVKDVTHGKNNVDISIAGQTGADVSVLSSMFAKIGVKFTFFKFAVDANGYILDSEIDYDFSYWLAATTADSATVGVSSPLKNPVNVTWDLGQVGIKAFYRLEQQQGGGGEVVVATSSFPFVLNPGMNNMTVFATLVSEPSLNVCAGYPQPVSPLTFCAANEIVSRVLSKTSTNGIPLRLQITTTNMFKQEIIIEVSLAILSFDNTPTRGKVMTPNNLYIIDSYEFNFLSSAWSSLSSASLTLDMSITLYNPFNITLTATSLALSLYLKDWEGGRIENSAVAQILGKQTVPPADNMFLLTHTYSNPAGVTIRYKENQQVDVPDIQVSGLTSGVAVHLYDNYEEKSRACLHATNGVLKFAIQGPSSPVPLTVTQFFSRRDISAAGWAACQGPQNCTNTQTISTWTTSSWSTMLQVNAGTAGSDAGVDAQGLRLTADSKQYASAFINRRVLFADSWETSFDVYWDYGGWTATGIGEGLSMIFHDRPAGAGMLTDGYYGYVNAANTRSFAIVLAADHVRGCVVNCGEDMKIVRNGVEVPDAPTDEDPLRSQFVWGSDYWSTVTVKYNYDTKFMYIYVGSQLYLVWTVDFVVSNFADANGQGFVGFAARTANFYQGMFRVRNWQWKRYKVQQENVRIDGGNGLNIGFAGPQASSFLIDTRDSCNFAVYTNMINGNFPLFVLLSGRSGWPSEGKNVNASSVIPVTGFPGLLKVVVFVNVAGMYDVHVKCNDVACVGGDSFSLIGNVEVSSSY